MYHIPIPYGDSMGTKGKDLVFWLFIVSISGAVTLKHIVFTWTALCFAFLLIIYYKFYIPKAIQQTKMLGLKTIVLLPLWPGFTNLYRIMAGKTFGKGKAYEFHIINAKPAGFLKNLENDLMVIKHTVPGVFYWETSAPVPAVIRSVIRQKIRDGKALWQKGTWPIPRAPGAAREIAKKHCYVGAIYLERR